jgi:hypothetical protein
MSFYAHIEGSTVTEVLVVPDGENGEAFLNGIGFAGRWVEAVANLYGGVSYDKDGNPVEVENVRFNTPGPGFTYDEARDAFIPPPPDQGEWVLDEATCLWVAVGETE